MLALLVSPATVTIWLVPFSKTMGWEWRCRYQGRTSPVQYKRRNRMLTSDGRVSVPVLWMSVLCVIPADFFFSGCGDETSSSYISMTYCSRSLLQLGSLLTTPSASTLSHPTMTSSCFRTILPSWKHGRPGGTCVSIPKNARCSECANGKRRTTGLTFYTTSP